MSSHHNHRRHNYRSRSRSPRRQDHHNRHDKRDEGRNRQERRDRDYDRRDREERNRDDRGSSKRSMFDFSESGEHNRDKKKRTTNKDDDFEKLAQDLNQIDYEEDFGGFKRPRDQVKDGKGAAQPIKKEEPCFDQSGILAEFSNNVKGVVLKFTEPLDAAVPTSDSQWAIYPFKGDASMGKQGFELIFRIDPVKLGSKQSVYLFGRDNNVADILLENPSCSMQHAVIQFREKHVTRTLSAEEQTARGLFQGFINEIEVRPYLMDLESTNKTFLNNSEIEPARYYELRDKDILRFGESTREYVLMKK